MMSEVFFAMEVSRHVAFFRAFNREKKYMSKFSTSGNDAKHLEV
jgi:hypothetical protein